MRGEPLVDERALDSLKATFHSICPECFVLSFELYDPAHFITGPTINKGGKSIVNMACANVFYNDSVLEEMIETPPVAITQSYLVCTDSFNTAIATGISNAYASAGLYSKVLLAIIMFFVLTYHHHIAKGPPINSPEEHEVVVRNAVVDVLVFLLNEKTNVSCLLYFVLFLVMCFIVN